MIWNWLVENTSQPGNSTNVFHSPKAQQADLEPPIPLTKSTVRATAMTLSPREAVQRMNEHAPPLVPLLRRATISTTRPPTPPTVLAPSPAAVKSMSPDSPRCITLLRLPSNAAPLLVSPRTVDPAPPPNPMDLMPSLRHSPRVAPPGALLTTPRSRRPMGTPEGGTVGSPHHPAIRHSPRSPAAPTLADVAAAEWVRAKGRQLPSLTHRESWEGRVGFEDQLRPKAPRRSITPSKLRWLSAESAIWAQHRQTLQAQYEKAELSECTFHPQISINSAMMFGGTQHLITLPTFRACVQVDRHHTGASPPASPSVRPSPRPSRGDGSRPPGGVPWSTGPGRRVEPLQDEPPRGRLSEPHNRDTGRSRSAPGRPRNMFLASELLTPSVAARHSPAAAQGPQASAAPSPQGQLPAILSQLPPAFTNSLLGALTAYAQAVQASPNSAATQASLQTLSPLIRAVLAQQPAAPTTSSNPPAGGRQGADGAATGRPF
ncbi:hypothetical protein PAPYR_4916 [Paratrimastix pyriformis]|uniref:Uncharacterized protein n=1 Tax=Paratrimastix pyriformis TaxID=342808 RepID=A0ABQ8UIR8_9EUKA|nr:hypothetical protein PAPYR_4916 [Paratrimastix pyriformis]